MPSEPGPPTRRARVVAAGLLFLAVVVAGVLLTEVDERNVASTAASDAVHEAFGTSGRSTPAVDATRAVRDLDPAALGGGIVVAALTAVLGLVTIRVGAARRPALVRGAPRRGPPTAFAV